MLLQGCYYMNLFLMQGKVHKPKDKTQYFQSDIIYPRIGFANNIKIVIPKLVLCKYLL